MKLNQYIIHIFILIIIFLDVSFIFSQSNLGSTIDSTIIKSDTNKLIQTEYGDIDISGYIQPQFQIAQSKGAKSYGGGDFSQFSNNRFALRRARVKFDYLYDKPGSGPIVFLAIQINATEKGVSLRDMYGQIIEPKWKKFSLYAGLFSVPFGFETNMSSSVRESPERTRMNQILLPSERDLGIMVSFNSALTSDNKWGKIKASMGLFNGGGLSSTNENDSYKNLITRIQIHSIQIGKSTSVAAGISGYYGNVQSHNEDYFTYKNNFRKKDKDILNVGRKIQRVYFGADLQIKRSYSFGASELRIEYISGNQPGSYLSNNISNTLNLEPLFNRRFAGGYAMFLQNIFNHKHQIILKYDIYDPNLDYTASNFAQYSDFELSDSRFTTFGLGYLFNMNKHVKAVVYYDKIWNEAIDSNLKDLKDDLLTFRIQFSF